MGGRHRRRTRACRAGRPALQALEFLIYHGKVPSGTNGCSTTTSCTHTRTHSCNKNSRRSFQSIISLRFVQCCALLRVSLFSDTKQTESMNCIEKSLHLIANIIIALFSSRNYKQRQLRDYQSETIVRKFLRM